MVTNNDRLWYKDAIIYELHIRSFFDSNADGTGDFPGLISKLDYLRDLGVNTVWLLPFYPSPLKDDGYDIADYFNIQPAYGNMSQFEAFIDEAHRHSIRVITELVINHTSDRHSWFQRARQAPEGSNYRNFYVWNDSPEKYKETRIIFTDTEKSNWSWDPAAKQYYWHRFYSHQPDLNFDNPEVQSAILEVMDYWLETGVDGLRVDAVPYLYERDGTNCENLPETHAFVKKLRAHFDKNFKGRLLLAEANQWPEDTAAYFGKGDEFHMAFHFPIMPRLYMSLCMEDRFPVIDILNQTPPIPDTCQWGMFLRNHDELTLEMVTEEERDYMYREYAPDPAARLNLGIRRRLAPLLGNDRRKIELMNSLLFSLPGTPFIYYGDELGMGDNYHLFDRNGVRTPMQWDSGRNAGFSQAAQAKLCLPLIINKEYHYKALNVANQQGNSFSLLSWMKRIIETRKKHPAFGRGSIEFLQPENSKILAYFRRYKDETILVIANLSHLAQQVELDLSEFKGCRPIDLFGYSGFETVTVKKYPFMLGPYAFYWFSLEKEPARADTSKAGKNKTIPVIDATESSLFGQEEKRPVLESVLLEYAQKQRWYRSKARRALSAKIRDIIPLHFNTSTAYFTLIQIDYAEGEAETYALPLLTGDDSSKKAVPEKYHGNIVARLKHTAKNRDVFLYDAMVDPEFCAFLLNAIQGNIVFQSSTGEITASPACPVNNQSFSGIKVIKPSLMKTEQSNTSISYGDRLILKLYRKLEEGTNPDVEIGLFLTEKTRFKNIARVAGTLEYKTGNNQPVSLGILQDYIPNKGDAWQYTLGALERYFKAVTERPTPPVPAGHFLSLPKKLPQLVKDTLGNYIDTARLLGQRTAEMHIALASAKNDPDFKAQPFTMMYQASLYQSLRGPAMRTIQLLQKKLTELPKEAQKDARSLVDKEKIIIDRFDVIRRRKITAWRIRCHGDYHLGQVLDTGNDFFITDFEGEPARPLSDRRLKRSPLKDVAGMVRSFDYAVSEALTKQTKLSQKPARTLLLKRWARFWYTWTSAVFLNSYLDIMKKSGLLPEGPEKLKILLDAFILEKALYEVSYELNNRPDWIKIPVRGILNILEMES
jgi:maltose alpha-D-glucosyltransferase/alpha-amylase